MSSFTKQSLIYSFSTENLSYLDPIFQNYSHNKTNALTITGSGDQAVMLSLLGYKNIYLLDINEYANFYADLKLKALSVLSFIEFKNFFLNNTKIFQFEQYQCIRTFLNTDAQQFWDRQYSLFNFNGEILYQHLFHLKYDYPEEKINNSFYLLSESNYLKAQQLLSFSSFHFLCFPVQNLFLLNTLQFDYILLSNLHDYSHLMFLNEQHIESFRDNIIKPLYNNHLNSNGLIMMAYVFDSLNILYSDKRNCFNIADNRAYTYDKIFNYYEKKIPSAITNAIQDTVCFIKK